jgi:hypothetical protein
MIIKSVTISLVFYYNFDNSKSFNPASGMLLEITSKIRSSSEKVFAFFSRSGW